LQKKFFIFKKKHSFDIYKKKYLKKKEVQT